MAQKFQNKMPLPIKEKCVKVILHFYPAVRLKTVKIKAIKLKSFIPGSFWGLFVSKILKKEFFQSNFAQF